jgi:hypothetical protein
MYILYSYLENYLPDVLNIPGLDKKYYKIINNTIIINNEISGIYGEYEIRKYIKIKLKDNYEFLTEKYPIIKKLKWPCEIGRYDIDDTTIDVVFDIYNLHLEINEINAYLYSNYGLWDKWIYGLNNSSLATITMNLIKDIPKEKKIPWYIIRYITAMIDSSNNENGIIHGKWDGQYSDGKPPKYWSSVSQIMNERLHTNKPVKYGQCWVLSEVLTGMFRFLGIPSRTILAENAHIDCGMDKGVDIIEMTTKGSEIKYVKTKISSLLNEMDMNEMEIEGDLNVQKGNLFGNDEFKEDQKINVCDIINKSDRCWNFHVWTEAYVCRNDIDDKYNWQICDPSPVTDVKNIKEDDEFHDKHFFGPCPVPSIKNNTNDKYDHPYLYSSVNSLWRYWTNYRKDDINIIYPYNINYKIDDNKKVVLYTRDHIHSKYFNVVKYNLTHEYRYRDTKLALESYHRDFPFLFTIDDKSKDIKIIYKSYKFGKYLLQICYLKNKLMLNCHRKIYTKLENIIIPSKPHNTDLISILCVNLDTKEFYPQILSFLN